MLVLLIDSNNFVGRKFLSFARTLLIMLVFTYSSGLAYANHGGGHHSDHEPPTFKRKIEQKIAQYKKEILAAFGLYEEKTAQVWGKDTVVPDTNIGVTYYNSLNQRSIVDYEKGTIKVEVAVGGNSINQRDFEERLADAVEQTILQGTDERSIIEMADNPVVPENPVALGDQRPSALAGLVADEQGNPIKPYEIKNFKKRQSRALQKRHLKGRDGVKRMVLSTQFKLVPNHIRKRAEKYQRVVNVNAQKHRISTPLIYAIMETESFFNPTAKSSVPAFGLMQLVPATGARDAYKFLHSKDWLVKETYLYNSKNNIELGVAYLHILYFRYLKRIKNPESKQWATIAAYNTGVRNVYRSFAGKYKKSKFGSRGSWNRVALKKINKMNSEQVYKHLRRYLPYEETRSYLEKVRTRMKKYGL